MGLAKESAAGCRHRAMTGVTRDNIEQGARTAMSGTIRGRRWLLAAIGLAIGVNVGGQSVDAVAGGPAPMNEPARMDEGEMDPVISSFFQRVSQTARSDEDRARALAEAEQKAKEDEILRERAYIKRALELAAKIEASADRHEKWINSTGGLDGMGEIERLRIRAEYFAFEKQYRLQLQDDTRELVKTVRDWIVLRRQARTRDRILELEREIAEMRRAAAETQKPKSITTFEFYTVKIPMTLRQISELPEVYGDATLWESLYQANKNRVADPEKNVAAGVTLVVPRLGGSASQQTR